MADSPPTLLEQLSCHMAQSRTTVDGSNIRGSVDAHAIHAVQFQDEVAILTAQPKGGITVAAAFWTHFQTELRAARHGGLDMIGGSGHHDGRGGIGQTSVERRSIAGPGAVALGFIWDAGSLEAVTDGSPWGKS